MGIDTDYFVTIAVCAAEMSVTSFPTTHALRALKSVNSFKTHWWIEGGARNGRLLGSKFFHFHAGFVA